jgi:hypothetical protein
LGLLRYSDYRRLGNGGREPDSKTKWQQQRQGAASDELIGQVLANREDAQIKSVQEQGNAHRHYQEPRHQLHRLIRYGAEDQQLKQDNDDNDGQEVLERL